VDGGVVIFAEGLDPADMVKDKKDKELIKLLLNPIPMIKYIINYIVNKYDLNNAYAKQDATKEVNEYLTSIEPLMATEYKQYSAQILQVELRFISLGSPVVQNVNKFFDVDIVELMLIKTMIENDKLVDICLDVLPVSSFKNYTKEFELLINKQKEDSILRAIEIRDDVKSYTNDEFLKVLKFKQKKELEIQLEIIKNSDETNEVKLTKISEIKKQISYFR